MRGFVALTVEGRPFLVRCEAVLAIGTGWRELPLSEDQLAEIRTGRVKPDAFVPQREIAVMVTVDSVGTIPVEESVEEVLSVLGERVNSPEGAITGAK